MKNFLLVLVACFGLAGCAEESFYAGPPAAVTSGSVEFCDDWGCRMVNAPYYYADGEVVYWDTYFSAWIGPRNYWYAGMWHPGWIGGYHGYYGTGYYHYFGGHPAGWRAGSGFHGSFHGGYHGGFHGGGHR
jgi:hypothetical protein